MMWHCKTKPLYPHSFRHQNLDFECAVERLDPLGAPLGAVMVVQQSWPEAAPVFVPKNRLLTNLVTLPPMNLIDKMINKNLKF